MGSEKGEKRGGIKAKSSKNGVFAVLLVEIEVGEGGDEEKREEEEEDDDGEDHTVDESLEKEQLGHHWL